MNLGDTLDLAAERRPHETALYCGDAEISYQSLSESTTALAHWFLDWGLEPGDRVAVHWTNSIEAVQLLYGIVKAGLIAVTINTRLKPPEIGFILGHSQARLCFSEPALAPLAQQAGGSRPVMTSLPSIGESGPRQTRLAQADPDQPAVLFYTSGTTARPKGVIHTHRSIVAQLDLFQGEAAGLGDRSVCPLPVMHAAAFVIVAATIHYGRSMVLLPRFDPALALDTIERFGCDRMVLMPALWHMVVAEQERAPRRVASITSAAAGGDAVPLPLQERFQTLFGVPLQEVYALTEAIGVTMNPIGALRPGSIGKPLPGVELRIVNAGGQDAAEGEAGELLVQSPGTCAGYWNDAAATSAAMEGGWLRTGDLVSRDSDGYYWFRGRVKEIIVRAGSNISPQEVEEVLYRHPAVLEAGVVGQPDPVFGEIVTAFIALREGMRATPEELREFARQSLADYKTPERFIFLPLLPKGPTGKVQRRTLKEMRIAAGA